MKQENFLEWAAGLFGACELGDSRRVDRLVSYAALQREDPSGSTSRVCNGETREALGAYRFLRNPNFCAQNIDEGSFPAVAERCEERGLLLAIQDTTTISMSHLPLHQELQEHDTTSAYLVHTTLMYDLDQNEIVGVIDQDRWRRKKERPGAQTRRQRPYEEKESFKWQASHERMTELLLEKKDFITVCDREADIFEFLHYHDVKKSGYVIRCSWNRRTEDNGHLWDALESSPKFGDYEIAIGQRGAGKNTDGTRHSSRQKRTARFELRACKVELSCPKLRRGSGVQKVSTNAVYLKEISLDSKAEPIIWRLLTSEDISCEMSIRRVIKIYEKRWLIEEFHKCWKTGCRVEERAFQTFATVEKYMAISLHIASSLLQLKMDAMNDSTSAEKQADIDSDDWVCLHFNAYQKPPETKKPPSRKQVYQALCRLGGFLDTKRTGIAGWQTLWKGYHRFLERLSAWKLAKQFYEGNGEKM